ncbi:hypothetical protein [Streptomyces sp. NPDC096013]
MAATMFWTYAAAPAEDELARTCGAEKQWVTVTMMFAAATPVPR